MNTSLTVHPLVRQAFSAFVIASMLVISFAPLLALPQIARAANAYVITQTGSATILGTTVSFGGTASADYAGNLNDQHISIDWDEDQDATANDWETEDSDASGNDDGNTPDITFDIDSFDDVPPGTSFEEDDWSATHTYSNGGEYTVFVSLHHAQPSGEGEGSDFSTIQIDIFIPPQCDDDVDNDDDGFIDYPADPGCEDLLDDDEFNEPPPTTGTLTLVKVLPNDNGGDAAASDFAVYINDVVSSWGAHELEAGDYTVSEDTLFGYSPSAWGGACDAEGNVSIAAGESYECSITNDDIAPLLTLVKEVIGGLAVATDWTLFAKVGEDTVLSGAGGATSDETFQAGTYDLSESAGPADYLPSGWSCGDVENVGSQVTLAVGQSTTCTITNTFTPPVPGSITIVKHTEGGDGTFDFSITGGDDFSDSPSIETSGGTGSTGAIEVAAGTYDVIEETVPTGWNFDGAECIYDEESVGESIENGEQVTLGEDDSVTCHFYNVRETASFLVQKIVINDDEGTSTADDFFFQVNGGEETPFTEDGENSLLGEQTINVPTGAYSVVEVADAGYTTTYSNNQNENTNCDALPITEGSEVVCTITNDDIEGPPAPQCSDGIDNDGDDKIDFHNENPDPGCDSAEDNDETDTPPPTGGVCEDGIDNDGDGEIDFPADSGCDSISDDDEIDHTSCGGSSRRSTPAGEVLGATTEFCPEYLLEYIKFGNSGNNPAEVIKLQIFLNNFEAFNLAVNGTYDDASHNAVHAFQKKWQERVLTPWGATQSTGYVYYTTKKTINEIYCQFTREFPLNSQQEAEIARVKALGEAWTPGTLPPVNPAGGVQLPAPDTSSGQPEVGGVSTEAPQPAAAGASEGGGWWSNFWNWLTGN